MALGVNRAHESGWFSARLLIRANPAGFSVSRLRSGQKSIGTEVSTRIKVKLPENIPSFLLWSVGLLLFSCRVRAWRHLFPSLPGVREHQGAPYFRCSPLTREFEFVDHPRRARGSRFLWWIGMLRFPSISRSRTTCNCRFGEKLGPSFLGRLPQGSGTRTSKVVRFQNLTSGIEDQSR